MKRTPNLLVLACLPLALLFGCSADSVSSVGSVGFDGGGTGDGTGANPDGGGGDDGVGDGGSPGVDAGGGDGGNPDGSGGDGTGSDGSTDGGADIPGGPVCGNGRVEAGEECDDGNNFPGDGCNATCTSDESCGNGIVDPAESCDDGNLVPGDGCDQICRREEGCGNGIVEVGEQCDDGNATNGDGCSAECLREVFIAEDSDGDGIADFDEGNGAIDTDGDGITDDLDTDSDNDGIPDSVEAGDSDMSSEPVDTDGDGRPDFRDLDSDSDTISDQIEGFEDPDEDGFGNYADTDSDGDYVPDIVETTRDSDGDGTPDYLDEDSDNDSILDEHELFADSDLDGVPNRLDLDSDDDGIADATEAGDGDLATYPVDIDGDGQPDYIDVDSDGDGLPDGSEPGCAFGGPNRHQHDSDGDGYSDLAEVLVGSDPCTSTAPSEFREFTDFFFILPAGAPPENAPLEFSSNIVQADVSMAMDTTGSMGGEIGNLRARFSSFIFPQIRAQIPNVAFGVSTFDDFPCSGHGSGADQPFILRHRVTTNLGNAQSAINSIPLHSGADYFESGYESMFQTATGAGVSGCGASVPAFDPGRGRVPGEADGTIGGVGFRDGSFPIVIHITDAPAHDEGAYGGFAASRDEAVNALRARQIRLVGVVSGSDPRGQLEYVARETGAVVPTCAWDGARPGGCGGGQCCTGHGGAGRGADGGGTCPLVFDIDSGGNGLDIAAVTAIRALVNTTTFEVTTNLRRDDDEFILTGVDTRCFIQSIVPDHFEAPPGSCSTTPSVADINPPDGVNDSYRNVTPGTQLFFNVTAQNAGCVAETDMPQAFTAFIDVVGDGLTVLDTQRVTIIVPAASSNPSTVP